LTRGASPAQGLARLGLATRYLVWRLGLRSGDWVFGLATCLASSERKKAGACAQC